MLDLSPVKILVVLVVALIVLGPDKLPQMARQLGAVWGDLRRFRARLESDVRGAFPDLPATHEVAQAVRSPLAFLDRLADEHEKSQTTGATEGQATTDLPLTTETSSSTSNGNGNGTHGGVGETGEWHSGPAGGPLVPIELDDPSMN
jgi:sec-independent protein translocase protein TatB